MWCSLSIGLSEAYNKLWYLIQIAWMKHCLKVKYWKSTRGQTDLEITSRALRDLHTNTYILENVELRSSIANWEWKRFKTTDHLVPWRMNFGWWEVGGRGVVPSLCCKKRSAKTKSNFHAMYHYWFPPLKLVLWSLLFFW